MLSKYPAWRLHKKMTTAASTRAVNAFKDSLPSWVPKPTCYLTAIGEEMLEWDWDGGYIEITFDDYGVGELYASNKGQGVDIKENYVHKFHGLTDGVMEILGQFFYAFNTEDR